MPFREKIAWISATTTLVIWGAYFGFMIATHAALPGPVYLAGFVAAVIAQAILTAAAAIIVAVEDPKEAGAAADERDKLISRRAYAIAYPVLLSLVVLVAASMHLGVSARGMAYEIMAAIAIAEIVHYGTQIVGYRRGWHG